ncbi:MAG: PAS domain S-box protein [Promethearchaeota archaeon]
MSEWEEKYRALLDHMSSGVAVYKVVNDGGDFIFIDINKMGERINKVKKEDIIGKSLLETFPGVKSSELFNIFQKVWKTGRSEYYPITLYQDKRISYWMENYVYKLNSGEIVAIYNDLTELKQKEEELRNSEEKYRAIFTSGGIGVVKVSTKGEALEYNERLLDFFGYNSEEFKNKTFMELTHPDDLNADIKFYQDLLKGKIDHYSMEKRYFHKNGEIRWGNLTVSLVRNNNMEPSYAISLLEDITNRKIVEEKIKESEEKFKTIFMDSPIGIELYDSNGILLDANTSCLEIFGVEDINSTKGFKLFEDPNVSDEVKDRLYRGKTIKYESFFDFEKVKKLNLYETTKSGKIFLDVLIKPIYLNGYENASNYLVQVQDITEKKLTEQKLMQLNQELENKVEERTKKLKESEEKYRSLYQHAPLPYQSLDENGMILDVNQAWLDFFKYNREEVIGKWLGKFIIPESRDFLKDRFTQFKKEGEAHGVQYEVIRKDGTHKIISFNGKIGYDQDGNFLRTHCIFEDITLTRRFEQKLKESEEKFRILTEQSLMGICIIQDNKIKYANQAISDICEYSVEEMLSWDKINSANFIHPDDLVFVSEQMMKKQKGIDKDVDIHYSYRLITKKKKIKWVEQYSKSISYEGRPADFATIMDITERQQAENKIRKEHEYLINVIDSLTHPFYVININDYTIELANSAAMNGNAIQDLKCYELYHRSDKPCADNETCPLVFIKKTKAPISVVHHHYDKNGNLKIYEVNGNPMFDEDGNVSKIIEYSIDITDRKIAENKLKDSEEKYRHLFESSPNAIILTNKEGIIIDCNFATIKTFGYNKEELFGKQYFNLGIFTHNQIAYFIETYERLKQGAEIKPVEFQIKKKERSIIWINYQSSLVILEGEILVQSIVQDITEKKNAEEMVKKEIKKLKELDQIKTEFVYRASHELKTPLNFICSASSLLFNLYSDRFDEKAKELLRILIKGGEQLEELIKNILDISSIESNYIKLKKHSVNISNLIKNCVNDMRYLIEKRNLNLNLEIEVDYFVYIDEVRITQVVANLLSNAIKNTPKKGVITIKLEMFDTYFEICVIDTGIGFTKSERKMLFKKFGKIERYGRGLDIISEGSGLGLFITKEIVEAHNGIILLESKGRNKGSKFIIKLPINKNKSQ